jgi:hypothetical protein
MINLLPVPHESIPTPTVYSSYNTYLYCASGTNPVYRFAFRRILVHVRLQSICSNIFLNYYQVND